MRRVFPKHPVLGMALALTLLGEGALLANTTVKNARAVSGGYTLRYKSGVTCYYYRAADSCSASGSASGIDCHLIANGRYKNWHDYHDPKTGTCPSVPQWFDGVEMVTGASESVVAEPPGGGS